GAGRYFFESGGVPKATLKFAGADFVASDWTPIGAEASAGGGYDVVLKQSGTGLYKAWHTDANGDYASALTGSVSGSDASIQVLETLFNQDLNGDSTTGLTLAAIETQGATGLSVGVGHYFFETGGTPKTTLKYAGADFVAGQFGDWAPIGVEASVGGGYDVVWKMSGADQYTVWHTDADGNYAASLTGVLTGSDASIWVLETLFNQDLNGDTATGATLAGIEAQGATSLSVGAGHYFFETGGSPEATLRYSGADYVTGQFGGWAPIAVEASAGGGYDVVWKMSGADQYTAWHTDSGGNYASSLIGAVSGTDVSMQLMETLFNQDLNGDSTTGLALTPIEAQGSTGLSAGAGHYFFETGGSPETTLKFAGADVTAGQFGDWAPIAAEASAEGGYDVVWKMAGADQYVAWHTDAAGSYAESLSGVLSGKGLELQALEDIFSQDLNGDGTVGIAQTEIETSGATGLVAKADYYIFGGTPEATLKYAGADVTAGQFGDWTPIAAEAATGGGYDVVWKMTDADQYTAWHVDANGNYASSLLGAVSGNDAGLVALETRFGQDLNSSGFIG
ncbi:MAG: hypothetical protein AB7G10_18470, partial [Reyranellaceae bacterium]